MTSSTGGPPTEVRPANTAPPELLLEMMQSVRKALIERGEAPAGEWTEQSSEGLRSGRLKGWYLPGDPARGLAFHSANGALGYGHVHVTPGPRAVDDACTLVETTLGDLPGRVTAINLGFTGLRPEEERSALQRLGNRPGSTTIRRIALEREVRGSDVEAGPKVPSGLMLRPIRSIPVDALAEFDVRVFRGTVDAALMGDDLAECRRIFDELLAGRMGRFLDEASIALVDPKAGTLVAAILTAELSPRRAVFLDLMVDPDRRRAHVGTFLLAWGLRALWAMGYDRAHLWVTEDNRPARGLYDRFGFSQVASAMIYRWSRPTPGPQAHVSR